MLLCALAYHSLISPTTFILLISALGIIFVIAAFVGHEHLTRETIVERGHKLSILANNMPDAVMRYNNLGICTFASAAALDVLGRSPDELVGKFANDAVHPDALAKITAAQERLLSGLSNHERLTYRRLLDSSAGEPVYIEADCVTICEGNGMESLTIIVSCRDVTERVALEKEMLAARRHAENAALSKSLFLANMSHEIRTPMNGILGFSQLLLQSDLPVEERRYTELILDSCQSLTSLLNDILDLSKIESGQIAVTPGPVDLRHLLRGCIKLHFANAQAKGLEIADVIGSEVPPRIETDALRLRQILLNLLGNAVKFTQEGRIELIARREDNDLLIMVGDSGIGIPAERLEAIFHPFEQADNTTSRRFGGTGLGLSISRRLAKLLGGTLTAHSKPGQGSRFELRIPLVACKQTSYQSSAGITAISMAHPTNMPVTARILLAEDNEINQNLVSTMLERCGQKVDIAPNGAAAIRRINDARAQDRPYDLVLMDVQMPECDGYEATRTIRSLGITPDKLPIIALSANAYEDDVRAALDSGMQAHLAKPLHFAELVAALQRWLPISEPTDTLEISVRPEPLSPSNMEEHKSEDRALPDLPDFDGLEQKWMRQRTDVLEAVATAVRRGKLADQPLEALTQTVHTLVGTAGMFGEEELGDRAREFEYALKNGASDEEQLRLANALLDAAC